MTNGKAHISEGITTEWQYVGFRRVPVTLDMSLREYGCTLREFKKGKAWREKGKVYKYTEPTTLGMVTLLYQQGKEMSPDSMPTSEYREERDIAALIKIEITTGILSSVSDEPTICARDALVTFLQNTYRTSAGAFFYFPESSVKRETA